MTTYITSSLFNLQFTYHIAFYYTWLMGRLGSGTWSWVHIGLADMVWVRVLCCYKHYMLTIHTIMYIRSHHLSLPLPSTPDLKLISFTNPFLHSQSFLKDCLHGS